MKEKKNGTPMERFEYMQLTLAIIPAQIFDHNHLRALAHDDYIYIEIRK
jgi:hypothetical protein